MRRFLLLVSSLCLLLALARTTQPPHTSSAQQAALTQGAGAVPTPQIEGIVNVRDYGAVGDGVADDTTAINGAISAAGNYGTVFFLPGTYRFGQLTLCNPITLVGGPTVRSRWNTCGANVTLLADGSADPAILIGGAAASIVTEDGREFAEGIRLQNFLLCPDGRTGRGIVVDGSTTARGTRGPARDIEFENVHVVGFADHNIEFLGNCFDIRFKGGSSRKCGGTAIIGTTAASYATTTPQQIYFYDFYGYGNDTGPQWALDGRFCYCGGGIAYGKGWSMGTGSQLIGTHVEGDYTPGGIGIQIAGYGCIISIPSITGYETGLQIGDGTATYSHAYNAQIGYISGNASTTCIKVTAGAIRFGKVETTLGTCGVQIVDARASSDGVYGSCNLCLQDYFTAAPTTGHWVVGVYARNAAVAVGKPQGWICTAAGTPGSWSEVGRIEALIGQTDASSR